MYMYQYKHNTAPVVYADKEAMHRRMLMEMAWMVEPIDIYDGIRFVALGMGITVKAAKECLAELVEEGLVLAPDPPERTRRFYSLPAETHLDLLTQMMGDKEWATRDLYFKDNLWFRSWGTSWADLLRRHATGRYHDDAYMIRRAEEYPAHVLAMAGRPEWKDIYDILPAQAVQAAAQWLVQTSCNNLRQPDIAKVDVLLAHPNILNKTRDYLVAYCAYPQYVWTANFDGIDRLPKPLSKAWRTALDALQLQYNGKDAEALAHYEAALRSLRQKCFLDPLLDFYYFLALIADGTTISADKMHSICCAKKTSDYTCEWIFLRLLTDFACDSRFACTPAEISAVFRTQGTPLNKVLTKLLVRHFHLGDDVDMNYAPELELLADDGLRLFQLEYSLDFDQFSTRAKELREATGFEPVLSRIRKKEKWELALEALQQLTKPTGKTAGKAATKTQARSRIIYLVDSNLNVRPRLQKSKDGAVWSAGRNIALSTFAGGLPEMDERARSLATLVRRYDYGWGGGTVYELGGEKAIACLAGCPLVFSEANPDLPVTIVKEDPQLTVHRTKDGFRIESNLGQDIGRSNTCVVVETDLLLRVIELSTQQRKLLDILGSTDLFPKAAEEQIAKLLPKISGTIAIHSDLLPGTGLSKVAGDSRITMLLQPAGDGIKAEMYVKPLGEVPPYCKPGVGGPTVLGEADGKKLQAQRDLKAERKNMLQAFQWLAPLDDCREETTLWLDDAEKSLMLLEILHDHSDALRTEWPQGVKLRLAAKADMSDMHISLSGAGTWFDIEGTLDIGEGKIVKMAELLDKLRQGGGRFVQMDEGIYIALSDTLRKQLQAIDGMTYTRRGKLQMPAIAAAALGAETQGWDTCQAFKAMTKAIEEAETAAYKVPAGLQAELRPYQQEGFRWLARLCAWGAGACLADDMGLGKTVQTIALLLHRAMKGASLVVAPASVLPNWKAELARFAPSLNVAVVNEAGTNRAETIEGAGEFDIVLTTYGLLAGEIEALAAKKWNTIVLDEAHTIKNKETKTSKAAMRLEAQARVLLTGTPLQNRLAEIWNLFQFADPGLLGSLAQFTDKFATPIERDHDRTAQKQLKRLLSPFILRRTKTDVLDELPGKTEITMRVELSPDERALYENLRRKAELGLEEGSLGAVQALAEISRLRQAACHPKLVDSNLEIGSAKSEAFMRLAEELAGGGHRALVFSQFTSHLALIREELDKAKIAYLYLDGSTPIGERARLVREFQTGNAPLMLISLKAGGLGLNLTAADYVVHLDPWWNPAIEEQASDRAYRIGQQRPVTVYRLNAADTIEEKILRLHSTKKTLADTLLEGSDMAARMGKDEILQLLRE